MLAVDLIDELELTAGCMRDEIVVRGYEQTVNRAKSVQVAVECGVRAGVRPVGEKRVAEDACERASRKRVRVLKFDDPRIVKYGITCVGRYLRIELPVRRARR